MKIMGLSRQEKKDLEAKKEAIEAKLTADKKDKLVEYMKPITQAEFDEYMRKFAEYTLQPFYEPWEFESEDLSGIQRMAIRVGLRPDVFFKENEDLCELVDAADKAANKQNNI